MELLFILDICPNDKKHEFASIFNNNTDLIFFTYDQICEIYSSVDLLSEIKHKYDITFDDFLEDNELLFTGEIEDGYTVRILNIRTFYEIAENDETYRESIMMGVISSAYRDYQINKVISE